MAKFYIVNCGKNRSYKIAIVGAIELGSNGMGNGIDRGFYVEISHFAQNSIGIKSGDRYSCES